MGLGYQVWFYSTFEIRENESGKMIWKGKACTVATAVLQLKYYRNHFEKPIAIFVGQRLGINEQYGHAWCLIMFKDSDRWKVLLKDSRCVQFANIPSIVIDIITALSITHIDLVTELPDEQDRVGLDCIGECYRAIADTLDGRFPYHLQKFAPQTFNTKTKKYVL